MALDISSTNPGGVPGELTLAARSNFYLQVRNNTKTAVVYGIAASFILVPTPSGLALFSMVGIYTIRRRR